MKEIPASEWDKPPFVAATDHTLPPGSRVFVDGEDVTNRAQVCHPVQGWVRAYVMEGDRIAVPIRMVVLVGNIEIRPGE